MAKLPKRGAMLKLKIINGRKKHTCSGWITDVTDGLETSHRIGFKCTMNVVQRIDFIQRMGD
jgi:hypothetical protein